MSSRLRALARDITPPALRRAIGRLSKNRPRYAGQPANWQQACQMSSGYDNATILERVTTASRAVEAGLACFERDSVLFQEPEYPFPLLSTVLGVAARNDGNVSVLDFGGSLGSSYRQCRPLLTGLNRLRWCVVEQAHFVAAGRAEFCSDELRFAESVAEAATIEPPQVLLACGVLQYLEDPEAAMRDFASCGATWLLIDRAPLSDESSDVLCIQHVPASIYEASYPCRLFSRQRLMAQLLLDWKLVCEFPCREGQWQTDEGVRFEFRGLLLQRPLP